MSGFDHPLIIGVFVGVILLMLFLDLGVFNKKSHVISNKEALSWTIVWITLAMSFSGFIYLQEGFDKFAQFQSAYWIEEALSIDNLFVFILVFNYFNLKDELQHKVLFWGIIGAIVFRALFIFSGIELIRMTYLPEIQIGGMSLEVNLVLTIFGFFLIWAGIKSALPKDEHTNEDFGKSFGARVIRKFIPVSNHYYDDKFIVRHNNYRFGTRLLLVLAVVESTDLIFAIDSIPAIFAIAPDDPFILYMSNIFAILGLRSMYFLLANSIDKFSKLKYGLAVILTFIGCKMVFAPIFHIDASVSLLIVVGVLVSSVVISLITAPKVENLHPPH
jgi:tellurite resistance protein TerC